MRGDGGVHGAIISMSHKDAYHDALGVKRGGARRLTLTSLWKPAAASLWTSPRSARVSSSDQAASMTHAIFPDPRGARAPEPIVTPRDLPKPTSLLSTPPT